MKIEDLPVFKIGDRVIYKDIQITSTNLISDHNLTAGGHVAHSNDKKGTIKSDAIERNDMIYYAVEFDEIHKFGWSCNGKCKDKHGYNVSPIFLELIENRENFKPVIKWYKNGKLSENLNVINPIFPYMNRQIAVKINSFDDIRSLTKYFYKYDIEWRGGCKKSFTVPEDI